jgi:hypothetical protein
VAELHDTKVRGINHIVHLMIEYMKRSLLFRMMLCLGYRNGRSFVQMLDRLLTVTSKAVSILVFSRPMVFRMAVVLFCWLPTQHGMTQDGPVCDVFTNAAATGPTGLGGNTVYGVYASGSTVYAGTSYGLSISTDGGFMFANKTTVNFLGSNTLQGSYASGSTVYAATSAGLSISTDGGATFTNKTITNGLGNNYIRGVYAIGSTVYAATNGGLSISTDGGATFTNKTTTNGLGNNSVYGVYAIGSTVYAATTGGLSISTDGGATFTNRTTTDGLVNNRLYGVYVSGSNVYAATEGGISISTDGGATFTNITTTNGLGNNIVRGVYASGTTVYAATIGGLSISTDGGATFTNKTTTNGLGHNTVYGVYVSGSTVYAATHDGLSKSTDGGSTFSNRAQSGSTGTGLGHNVVNKVYASGSTVYAATTGGLSISADGGATFTNKTTTNGLGNNAVQGVYVSGTTVYAATSGGLSISTDGGATFTNRTTTDGLGHIIVRGVYASGSTVYAPTTGGLGISTDGGTSFVNRTSANGLGHTTVYGVYAIGSTVFAATSGGLSISADGGATFTNKTTTNGLGSNTVYGVYASGTTVYAATSGGLSISADGGVTFTNKTTTNGLGNNSVSSVYAIGSTVYAATVAGLSISTDGGATYTNKTTTNGLGNNTVSGVYASGCTIFAATYGGVSFCTQPNSNPTSGGTIAAAQSGSSPFDPAAFTSSAAPSGHTGTLEYKWQSSTTSSSADFNDIASSNSETYDAGALTQTTWYKRLARVSCSSDWTGAAESNILEVTISSFASEPTAQPTALYFTTTGSDPYNFVGNFTASGSASGYLVVRNIGGAPTFTPTDGTAYTAGSQTGGEIVYAGALTSFTESSVTNDQNYHYSIYAFNGSDGSINYLTTSPLTGTAVSRSTGAGSVSATSTGTSMAFPAAGATVNFPSGTSGTNLTVSKVPSAPSSNIQVKSSIRGMKPLYFSITSSTTAAGTYTLILDFSGLGALTPTQWNSYKITKRADANSPWVDVTTLGATIVSRQTDGVWGKFTITGLSSFSEFGVAEVYDGVLVSNLDQTADVSPATVSNDDQAGQAFVTDGIRYNLSKVKVAVNAGDATTLRVNLYGANPSDGSVDDSGSWPISFGTPVQVGSTNVYEFTPSSPLKLEPSTQYWVIFYTTDTTGIDLDVSLNSTETGPASYPANLSVYSSDGGATFAEPDGLEPIMFSIEATEVTRTWTGGSSTAWSASGNWTPSETPGNGEIMTIPNEANDPVLDGNIAPANLIVEAGTVLNMADKNITLTQGFSNDGSLTSTTGKLILSGSSAQGIVGTGSISRLEVNNSAGVVISAGSHMQTITGMLTPTSGTLSTNGNLTLQSDATGTARVGEGSASGGYVTGAVITQRHLTKLTGAGRNGRAWRLVSVPVEGAGTLRDYFMAGRSGADLTVLANRNAEPDALGTVVIGHNQPDAATATGAGFDWIGVAGQVSSLRYFQPSSGSGSFGSAQVPSLSTDYSSAAQGYMLFARGDRQQQYNGTGNSSTTKLQATGSLKQGTQNITIAALATAGYVLVGNPYMSVIDMEAVYNDNASVIEPIVYIWDANSDGNSYKQGGYRTITRTGPGAWTTTGGGSNPQYIESHAAFFVRPTVAGGTLEIKESHKVSGTPGIAPHGTDGNNAARLFVNLEVADTANRRLVDGAVVFFDKDYSESLKDAVDIPVMSNITAGAVGLKQSGMRLAMEGRPWPLDTLSKRIPLDMRNLGDDAYVLRLIGASLTRDGFRAWLKDRHLKTETELKVDGELLYPFRRTGDAGIDSGRFEIVYRTTPTATGGTVTPDDASETEGVRLYPNPSKTGDVKLLLRAMAPGAYTVQVLDMLGREVATGSLEHTSINGEYRVLKGRRLSPGQYIIRLKDAYEQLKGTIRMVVE